MQYSIFTSIQKQLIQLGMIQNIYIDETHVDAYLQVPHVGYRHIRIHIEKFDDNLAYTAVLESPTIQPAIIISDDLNQLKLELRSQIIASVQ